MRHKKLDGAAIALLIISAICLAADVFYGITDGWDKWNFIALGFVLLIVVYTVIRTLRQRIPSNANPNHHTRELCENCDWTCVHGIAPDAKTGQCAWPFAHDGIPEPTAAERKVKLPIHHE